ncbi:peptidoglycan DD-metalloendopeptidase family protein [Kosmotoga pacifica]|uniref:peptidoglycan DD-metalloendopeptidase family protein n=1 Tax=Kosmotoga pacifica TaxID=1330330 RepID=UPI00069B7F6F|nr:peptidoglycan DD-metalloendopeptidase family protein [Kosmotoga pacifica]
MIRLVPFVSTLLLIFLLSGCSAWWVSRGEFRDELSIVEKKLDFITEEQKRLRSVEESITDISRQLEYLTGLKELAVDIDELKSLQDQLAELKKLLESNANNIEEGNKLSEQIFEKLDKIVSSNLQEFFFKKEIEGLKGQLESLQRRHETDFSYLENRIDKVNSLTATDTSFVSIDLFLAEVADIRSRIGQKEMEVKSPERIIYTVRAGDTLWDIAKAYGITVEELKVANPVIKDSTIYVGQEITIPVSLKSLLRPDILQSHFGLTYDFEPLVEAVISPFGSYDKGYANPGIDLKVPPSTTVKAILPGRVVLAEKLNDEYGNTVVIDHGDGMRTVYGKLNSITVEKGNFVLAGETIGETGKETPNLHVEIWMNDIPVNPADLLFENAGTFTVTMYTEWDDGKNPTSPSFKVTATGKYVKAYRTIAADPAVLPPGTVVYIPFFSNAPNKGFFVVEDTGSEIKGKRIDVYTHDIKAASGFKEELLVYVVKKP